jgi:hypothetical protein
MTIQLHTRVCATLREKPFIVDKMANRTAIREKGEATTGKRAGRGDVTFSRFAA